MAGIDTDLIELPQYANVYFEHVIGEYKAVHNANPNAPGDELADEIIKKYREGGPVTWGELYTLERLLVSSESLEALRARAVFLKSRYVALNGASGQQLPQVDPKADRAEVLASVELGLREVNRLMAVSACRERLRKRRLTWLVVIISLAVLLLMGVLIRFFDTGQSGLLVMVPVILMGALGGLVSSQLRVQSIPNVGESLADVTNLYFWKSNLLASAVSGAVFALVLWVMFAGKLMQGSLFPDISGQWSAITSENRAKLLIWSFIAGFAERFVPDTLDHLVARSSKRQ